MAEISPHMNTLTRPVDVRHFDGRLVLVYYSDLGIEFTPVKELKECMVRASDLQP